MHIGVIGAGAIGGWLTAGFIKGGARATVLARGASLAAMRADGLGLDQGDGLVRYPVTVTDTSSDLRGVDVLLLGLKAHDLPAAAPMIETALEQDTLIIPAINGLPWWFFKTFGGPAKGMQLDRIDPDGVLSRLMPAERIVGTVVHAASMVTAPAQIRLVAANRVILGDAGTGVHAADIAKALKAGGIPAEVSTQLHRDVWDKLWGNASMNPLSALSRGGLTQMMEDDGLRGLAGEMMREMSRLGARIGLSGFDDIEGRFEVARKLGNFRTSMLQDVEAGRALELDPILGGLVELAGNLGEEVPVMGGVYGMTRLLDAAIRAQNP